MASSKSIGIKSNWASISPPIIHTSIIEKVWSITRHGQHEFQLLHFKRSPFESLISQIYHDIVVDLDLLTMLSFESWILVTYWLSYGRLKFHGWIFICSILWICDDPCLVASSFVTYMEYTIWWCVWFGVLEHLFLTVHEQSTVHLLRKEEDEVHIRPRF